MTDLYPLRLRPSFRKKIWGVSDLAPFYAKPEAPIGEAWLTYEDNTVANWAVEGTTLGELSESYGERLLGAACDGLRTPGPSFPILSKLLFVSEKLSVQVHPDDAYALTNESCAGKTEMWYVVAAKPGAAAALGLTEDLANEEIVAKSRTGEIERFLRWVPVRRGDVIFVAPGAIHTLGPGLTVCEIQQNSDLTYRLYDFGRLDLNGEPRELHLEQAAKVIRPELRPGPISSRPLPFEGMRRELLAACSYFAAEAVRWEQSFVFHSAANRLDLLVFLEGAGTLGNESYQAGEAFVIPAEVERVAVAALQPTAAVRAYVPALAELQDELIAAGATPSEAREICSKPEAERPIITS